MPRRRGSRASTSSEQSTNSDLSENLNISEELPDPGLTKTNGKDDKEKKRVTFNFPLKLITKTAKFSGIGTFNFTEDSTSATGEPAKPCNTKDEAEALVYDLTQDKKKPESPRNYELPKTEDTAKKVEGLKKQEPPKKPRPVETAKKTKQGAKKKKASAKEAREAKRKEVEAFRDAIKKALDSEKQAKAEYEEVHKIYKPEECLKHMNIEIHPELSAAPFISHLKREAAALDIRVVEAEDICDPGLIMWTRFVPPTLANEEGQIKLTPSKEQCNFAMYVISVMEVFDLIAEGRINAHVALKQELIGGRLTLIVYGEQPVFMECARKMCMTQQKFTKAIADLQTNLMVEKQIDLLAVDTPEKLSCLVIHYTRAIAETPFKKSKRDIDEQADFYMRGDNKNCVIIDKYGNGLSRLWEQMIAILPMSSLEVARTIGSEYKTPRALAQELQAPGGQKKIADIGVVRTNVPGAKSRKLGPEFARKLHTLFTTEDGNTIIE